MVQAMWEERCEEDAARVELAAIPVPPSEVDEVVDSGRWYRTPNGGYLAIVDDGSKRRAVFSPGPGRASQIVAIAESVCSILLVNPSGTSALVSSDSCILHEVSLIDGSARRLGAAGVAGAARLDAKRVAILRGGELHLVERRGGALVGIASVACDASEIVALHGGRVVVALGEDGATFFGVRGDELGEIGRLDTHARSALGRGARVFLREGGAAWEVTNLDAAYESAFRLRAEAAKG